MGLSLQLGRKNKIGNQNIDIEFEGFVATCDQMDGRKVESVIDPL